MSMRPSSWLEQAEVPAHAILEHSNRGVIVFEQCRITKVCHPRNVATLLFWNVYDSIREEGVFLKELGF